MAVLLLFHGAFQFGDPSVQDILIHGLDVREDDSHAQHRLTVDDPGLGRKDFLVVRDADRDSTPDRPHLPRTDMASERAKITNHSL